MNPSDLAAFLAPIVPYLIKGGIELAKAAAGELGKKLSADSWDGMKELVEKIRQKAGDKPAAVDALQRAAASPDDPRVRGMLELYLEEILKENSDLAAEAARLLGTSVSSNVEVRDVHRGGKVTGVKVKGESPDRIDSNVKARDVSGEVKGVEISED